MLHQFREVNLVIKPLTAGQVLPEGIAGDKQLVFRKIRKHGIGPVQHSGFKKLDSLAPQADDLAIFNRFKGPSFGMEMFIYGLQTHLGTEYLLRLNQVNYFRQ